MRRALGALTLLALGCTDAGVDPAQLGAPGGMGAVAGTAGSDSSPAGGGNAGGSGGTGGAGGVNGGGASGAAASGGSPTVAGGAGGANGGNGGISAAGTAGAAGSAGAGPGAETICPPGPFDPNPVPDGAIAAPVCSGGTFAEGPVWFGARGSLFFSDFEENNAASNFNGDVMEYVPGGTCTLFFADTGTNGLAIATDGNLLGARHLDQTISSFELVSGASSVVVADFEGSNFGSPNDLTVRSDGNVYFTDPAFQVGNRVQELAPTVYRRDPSGNLSVVEQLAGPNGISLSPDETLLYVAQSGGGQVRVYDVDSTGATANSRTFITDSGSDGMVVDCAGNLYLTTNAGIRIYSPAGDLLTTLAAPGATNVAFGEADRTTLFITTASELLTVTLAIPGLPY